MFTKKSFPAHSLQESQWRFQVEKGLRPNFWHYSTKDKPNFDALRNSAKKTEPKFINVLELDMK